VALKLLLLALLAALSMAAPRRMLRRPRKDWFISAHIGPHADPDSDLDRHGLRRLRQARAELGWLLRGTRNKGMTPSGKRAPGIRPARAARAPPWRANTRNHPESVNKTPRLAAMARG